MVFGKHNSSGEAASDLRARRHALNRQLVLIGASCTSGTCTAAQNSKQAKTLQKKVNLFLNEIRSKE